MVQTNLRTLPHGDHVWSGTIPAIGGTRGNPRPLGPYIRAGPCPSTQQLTLAIDRRPSIAIQLTLAFALYSSSKMPTMTSSDQSHHSARAICEECSSCAPVLVRNLHEGGRHLYANTRLVRQCLIAWLRVKAQSCATDHTEEETKSCWPKHPIYIHGSGRLVAG